MRIPFVLIDNNGDPMLNQGNNACVQLSTDGAGFVDASGEVKETGSGCYYIDLTAPECRCTYYVNIKITIDGGQTTIIQYTPDIEAGQIADAVWRADQRTLTSLSTSSKKATAYSVSTKPSIPPLTRCSGVTAMQIVGDK